MGLLQRSGKIRPIAIAKHRWFNPLRQCNHTVQRASNGLHHHLRGDPSGERVDRLKTWQVAVFIRAKHIVRMYHLRAVIKHLQLARNQPLLPYGQQFIEVFTTRMEIDQLNCGLRIFNNHTVWLAPSARRNML